MVIVGVLPAIDINGISCKITICITWTPLGLVGQFDPKCYFFFVFYFGGGGCAVCQDTDKTATTASPF